MVYTGREITQQINLPYSGKFLWGKHFHDFRNQTPDYKNFLHWKLILSDELRMPLSLSHEENWPMWKYWANNRNFLSPTINYLLPSQLQMDPKSQCAPFGMAVLHRHGHTHTHKLFLSFSMLKDMLSMLACSICKIAGGVARDCDLAVKQKNFFLGCWWFQKNLCSWPIR